MEEESEQKQTGEQSDVTQHKKEGEMNVAWTQDEIDSLQQLSDEKAALYINDDSYNTVKRQLNNTGVCKDPAQVRLSMILTWSLL